ncbi:MAG TPA: stage II sporulation protein M [Clostridia bacterium]|nr:stage II sporulation protein M [Clostridia bacterium]
MVKVKFKLKQHFYASWWVYSLVGSCFLLGLFFGFLGMTSLEQNQTSSLSKLFEEGLVHFEKNFNFSTSARQAVLKNTVNLSKIFLMGLTIIGLPLVLVIIFTRGFVLGFTIEFLLQEKAWRGGLLALLTVLPPNLLSVPAYILGAVMAINFSLYLIKGSGQRKIKMSQCFLEYLLIMLSLAVLMLGSALIEGYFSPIFIKLFP